MLKVKHNYLLSQLKFTLLGTFFFTFLSGNIFAQGGPPPTPPSTIPTPSYNHVLYVKKGAIGNGSAWSNALGELHVALDWAKSNADSFISNPLQIWVAEGTYLPTDDTSDRTASFPMVNNVRIYGGFGAVESVLAQRDWNAHITILSGDLKNNDGLNFTNNADNSYNVVFNDSTGTIDNSAVLDGFTITAGNANNYTNSYYYGGGIHNRKASPTLRNLKFIANKAEAGGGVFNGNNSAPTISNVSILNNNGGGIFNFNAAPILKNVLISGNIGAQLGGGICNLSSFPKLTNVLITKNSANSGGGIASYGTSTDTLTNVTISDNIANSFGAIYNSGASDQTIMYNSLVLGNSSGINDVNSLSSLSANNLIQTGDSVSGGSTNGALPAIVNTTPQAIFVDFDNGNYIPQSGSYAYDGGDSTLYSMAGNVYSDKTLDNNPRLFGATIDIGALEYRNVVPNSSNVLFVKKGSIGDGSSWTNALGEVYDALDWAKLHESSFVGNPLQIWVAEGIYKPTDDTNGRYTKSFKMLNNVALYGGFAGVETSLSQRDWQSHITTLSGDLLGNDDENDFFGSTTFYENCIHVIFNTNLDSTAILDGFWVRGGRANEYSSNDTTGLYGGGMYNINASPTVSNTVFEKNYSDTWGGAMSNKYFSSPSLNNVTFNKNACGTNGGGICNRFFSNPTLTNVVFTANEAAYGAGISNSDSASCTVKNSVFFANYSYGTGGAISCQGASANLVNVKISENFSDWGGAGGIWNQTSAITLTNVTMSKNYTTGSPKSSPISNDNATILLYNCLILGNDTGSIQNINGGIIDALSSNNLIQVGNASSGGNESGIGAAINGTVPDSIFSNFALGDYTLKANAYAIDAGDNAKYNLQGNVLSDMDLAGNPRLDGSSIDIGAYERPIALPVTIINFDATQQHVNALLTWSTANEKNSKGFYLQHSIDAQQWHDLSFVISKAVDGNSNSKLSYDYLHLQPGIGRLFYRLKSVDFEGNADYSAVRILSFNQENKISLYPNPTSSSIIISGLENKVYQILLFENTGKLLQEYSVEEQNDFELNLATLPTAVYFLQIKNEEGVNFKRKVVKN